jgi:hypothetical protein
MADKKNQGGKQNTQPRHVGTDLSRQIVEGNGDDMRLEDAPNTKRSAPFHGSDRLYKTFLKSRWS